MENYHYKSRLTRKEEKNAYKKITLAIIGSIVLFVFIIFYGIPALINLAVFISNLKGDANIQTKSQNSPIPPPSLELPYEATNTASIKVKGSGSSGYTLDLFVNGDSFKKLVIPNGGNFTIENVPLTKGNNQLWATAETTTHQKSERSNIYSIIYKSDKPKMEITAPDDNATISNDTKDVLVSGQTEDGINITINDRMVIVDSSGNFSYTLSLNDGDNKITIVASDAAGNATLVERKVKYQAP